MTKRYITNSPELARAILSLETFDMVLAWYRGCLDVAIREKRESIADYGRELSLLWCEQNNGTKIEIVAR
jgi:hypothetical protein